MTILLGLTGSIGMGKTTTAQMFRDAGIAVWDADATVHDLYHAGGAAVPEIAARLPEAIVDGAVSRTVLKELIAQDLGVLSFVEGVVHPLLARKREEFIAARQDHDVLVFDIPLLFETRATDWLDAVACVLTDAATQEARVMARDGMTPEQFKIILARQMPDSEKRALADFIIPTDTLDQARAAVREVLAAIKQGQFHA